MAPVFKITDGASDTVNLLDSNNFEVRTIPRGVVRGLGQNQTAMEVVLKINKQATHNAVATDFQSLHKLLRRAEIYARGEGSEKTPIYFEQKADSEDNTRYSTIVGVQELPDPDVLEYVFEQHKTIVDLPFVVIRETDWRSNAPGTLPTASTLAETDGSASPKKVVVSNHRDEINITAMKVFDSSGSSYTDASAGSAIFPASPGTGDAFMWTAGTVGVPFNSVFPIDTPGAFTATLVHEYYNGSTWAATTYGDHYTLYPEPTTDESDFFKTAGENVLNWFGASDAGTVSVDGTNGYWQRLRISAFTSASQVPTLGTAYAQRTPEVRMPSALFESGDKFPLFNVRMHSPAGGDEAEGPENITKILAGVKSDPPAGFVSHLNAGDTDNPGAWAVTQLTDATKTADTEFPGASKSAVDFGTDSSMAARVRFTGTNLIDDYEGRYVVIVRAEQVGGDAGDINVKVVTRLGSTNNYAPHKTTQTVATQGADQGLELIDLRLLGIPFGDTYNADTIEGDLIFEIWAERVAGSATLDIADLILLPYEEGLGAWRAIPSADLFGAEAMRGSSILEEDMGVIAPRTTLYHKLGSSLVPGDFWAREGELFDPVNGRLDVAHRLYFVLAHAPTNGTWGQPPLISSLGQSISVEVFQHNRYGVLRGAS